MNKVSIGSGNKLLPYSTRGLGIFYEDKSTYLFHSNPAKKTLFRIDKSLDNENFKLHSDSAKIQVNGNDFEQIGKVSDFRVTKTEEGYFLTYKLENGKNSSLCAAESSDLINWTKIGNISTPGEAGVLVGNYKHENSHILYFGEKTPVLAKSSDLKSWKIFGRPIDYLGNKANDHINIMSAEATKDGVFVVYYQYQKAGKYPNKYKLKASLFENSNPVKVVWDVVFWQQKKDKVENLLKPLGVIILENHLISYWQYENEKIFTQVFPKIRSTIKDKKLTFIAPVVKKYKENPILKPISHHSWESKAVFNPAAFFDEGEVHIIYRAVGDKDVSTLGYAKSKDGVGFDTRHTNPVYIPTKSFEGGFDISNPYYKKKIKQSKYISGPGWGGCEDPRITKIEGKLHMTYVAFDGFNPQRVAITSIDIDDFRNDEWNWKDPVLLSPPGEVHKNWVIFPEKIRGKYAILHSISPSVLIDYVDSLDFEEGAHLKSSYYCTDRTGRWDSKLRGAGPPPIKTKDGWLLFYHAMDDNDPGKYKLGAMLLDYDNPEKILMRSRQPILEPNEEYENNGFKSGVIYACGSVIRDEDLYLYYGASDTTIAVASANINVFLDELKRSYSPTLRSRPGRTFLH